MFIKNTGDFNLEQTFECGQCFRWNRRDDGSYIGVAGGHVITAAHTEGGIQIDGGGDAFLRAYFDLERDYGKVKRAICGDGVMKNAVFSGGGIRLLRQQPWETLISFIISANNNIPRIKKIIAEMCAGFGGELTRGGFYAFPAPEVLAGLTARDLAFVKCGFRDKYILDAARKVASGEVDLSAVYGMSAEDGRRELKKINGVGDKVADCVLLFAYQKYDVFPKDVWIKKTLHRLYLVGEKDIDGFVREKFGRYGGFAQQYLFYYGRSCANDEFALKRTT
ncbi:MAG: 8-oxoguanine DNA glycosylase [Clostridiales bacterium]|jgi:N-glycosylase/DNA lyase|nr:8-oxoguanine DNA glycosylase [Clostridiales bacterium]